MSSGEGKSPMDKRLAAVKRSGFKSTREMGKGELEAIKSRKYALQQMARIQGSQGVKAGSVKAAAFKHSTGKIQVSAPHLEHVSPKNMHSAWGSMSRENRSQVREAVLAEPSKYPQIYHNIFHRQRKGLTTPLGQGLAGYTNR